MAKDHAYKRDDFHILNINVEPTGSYNDEGGTEVKTGRCNICLIGGYDLPDLLAREHSDEASGGHVIPHESVKYLEVEEVRLSRLEYLFKRLTNYDAVWDDDRLDEGKNLNHVFENAPQVDVKFKVSEDAGDFLLVISEIERI